MTALDVPTAEVEAEAERLWAERDRRIAKARLAARLDRVTWLIAHPEWHPARATDGEAAEFRAHLINADADDTTTKYVDLRKGRKL